MKSANELKTKTLTIVLTPYEHSLLESIRSNHKKSISQLVRDAIVFYGVFYKEPF